MAIGTHLPVGVCRSFGTTVKNSNARFVSQIAAPGREYFSEPSHHCMNHTGACPI